MELTTAADDLLVAHDGTRVIRMDGLIAATTYEIAGMSVTTLPRPAGELLCRVATVNDLHFGEVECGRIDNRPDGPIQRALPGEEPYPETMNRGAIAEIVALDPVAVIVKGDLTADGQPEELAAFAQHYGGAFGDRLHTVRGNHDAYQGQHVYAGDRWIELPGVAIALLDTVTPTETNGMLTVAQLDWLDAHAATADRPVLVMGHHQQWIADAEDHQSGNGHRSEGYFGLRPDPSDALSEIAARRRSIIAYTAGHTHRHRVRHMPCGVPSIEIGCVKDFPGTWAEYRVYEGGIMQVVHRVSSPEALAWSERCRHLYRDFGVDYETYALGALEDRCCNIPLR